MRRHQQAALTNVSQRWSAERYAPHRHIDWLLIIVALLLSAIGVVAIFGATKTKLLLAGANPWGMAERQVINIIAGLVVCAVAMLVDYRKLTWLSPLIWLAGIVGLLLVFSPLGQQANGATRWINLGGFQLQPSELAKACGMVAAAAWLGLRDGDVRARDIAAVLGIIGAPALLVFFQPDLGTVIVFVWISCVLLLVGGADWRWLVGLASTGIAGIVIGLKVGLLHDYQVARLTSFMNMGSSDIAQGSAWNANQSIIAVGSGGMFGKGFGNGSQTNLSYVPENHTDFVFTVIAEEFGFVGALVLLVLFAALIWRLVRAALVSADLFGTLIAAGTAGLLILQLLVNIGMTVGIMPVTGLPLPLVSYGGTSTLLMWLLIGVNQSIVMRRQRV